MPHINQNIYCEVIEVADVAANMAIIKNRLDNLGIFKDVEFYIQASEDHTFKTNIIESDRLIINYKESLPEDAFDIMIRNLEYDNDYKYRLVAEGLNAFDFDYNKMYPKDQFNEHPEANKLPGSQNLQSGHFGAGFYEIIDGNDFITLKELNDKYQVFNEIDPSFETKWMKYSFRGHVIYVLKELYPERIAWRTLYEKGLVFGEAHGESRGYDFGDIEEYLLEYNDDYHYDFESNGYYHQNKRIAYDGMEFDIRLLRGAHEVSLDSLYLQYTDYDGRLGSLNEYDALILPSHINALSNNWEQPENVPANLPDFGLYLTDTDLGVYYSSLCQNLGSSSRNCLSRGHRMVESYRSYLLTSDFAGCWRPVLQYKDYSDN